MTVLLVLAGLLVLALVFWLGECCGWSRGYAEGFQDGNGARWFSPTPGDS